MRADLDEVTCGEAANLLPGCRQDLRGLALGGCGQLIQRLPALLVVKPGEATAEVDRATGPRCAAAARHARIRSTVARFRDAAT